MLNLFFPSHWIFSVFNFPPSPASLTLLSTCLTPICPTRHYFTWHCSPCWACYLQLILPKTGFTSNLSHFNASTQLTTPINPSILQSSVYHQILFQATVGCIQVFFVPIFLILGFWVLWFGFFTLASQFCPFCVYSLLFLGSVGQMSREHEKHGHWCLLTCSFFLTWKSVLEIHEQLLTSFLGVWKVDKL